MEGDKSSYNQSDATGFIRLNALRLKLIAAMKTTSSPRSDDSIWSRHPGWSAIMKSSGAQEWIKMWAEVRKEIQLEIGHVFFIDIVGYSKLSINDQKAAVDELTQIDVSQGFDLFTTSQRLKCRRKCFSFPAKVTGS
jgi:hypothetical protein